MISEELSSLAIPLNNLEALPVNPRHGSIPAIKASFEAFGQLKPIVYRLLPVEGSDKRKRVVIAGNHMVHVARELGWTHIAGVNAKNLSEEEALAFAVADNRTSELGTTDQRLLAEYMQHADLTNEQWQGAYFDDEELRQYLEATTTSQFDGFLDDMITETTESFKPSDEKPLDIGMSDDMAEFIVMMTVAKRRETMQALTAMIADSDFDSVGDLLHHLVMSNG